MSNSVTHIDLRDLEIDPENVRDIGWGDDADHELIESIKRQGVIHPLTVRLSMTDSDAEYGIVCGSRRYNAAIDAGLDEVPCTIRELSDREAAGLSIVENRDRRGVPAHKEAFKAIEHYATMDGPRPERIETLAEDFGCGESTMRKYIELYALPPEARELVTDPSEWSDQTKTAITEATGDLPELPEKGVSIDKAAKVSRECYDRWTSDDDKEAQRTEPEIIEFLVTAIDEKEADVKTACEIVGDDTTVSTETAMEMAKTARTQNVSEDEARAIVEHGRTETDDGGFGINFKVWGEYASMIQTASVERNQECDELAQHIVMKWLETNVTDTASDGEGMTVDD